MITTRKISLEPKREIKEGVGPTVIPWNDTKMIRGHSIRAAVREMVEVSKSLDVVKFGIVGNQNSGKTTQLETIAHLIHRMSKIPFAVKILDKHALLNLEETISRLTPTNYVIGFDDTSFLGAQANKKQLDIIKQVSTEIRHLPGGQDVKIFLGMNYHYTLGVDKYLRQGEFKFFTSVGSSEIDNMEKIVGAKNMGKVHEFKKLYTRMLVSKHFTFMLGKKPFIYNYRSPFIPMLFWNEDTLRIVVSPTRQWIEKGQPCSICSNATNNEIISEYSENRFIEEGRRRFGPGGFDSALRIILYGNGINTYSPSVERAKLYINDALGKKVMNLEQMAVQAGFKVKKVQLHGKFNPDALEAQA